MNYPDLVEATRKLGMDPDDLLYFQKYDNGSEPSLDETAWNIVEREDGLTVLSAGGRGDLYEKPYDGHRFGTEGAVCDYIWRELRWSKDPALLTPGELAQVQADAEEEIARESAAFDESL